MVNKWLEKGKKCVSTSSKSVVQPAPHSSGSGYPRSTLRLGQLGGIKTSHHSRTFFFFFLFKRTFFLRHTLLAFKTIHPFLLRDHLSCPQCLQELYIPQRALFLITTLPKCSRQFEHLILPWTLAIQPFVQSFKDISNLSNNKVLPRISACIHRQINRILNNWKK